MKTVQSVLSLRNHRISAFALTTYLTACLLLLSAPLRLHAQALSGVTGTVTDESGAVIADAKVTVTNNATNVVNTAITSSAGTFTIIDLIPGSYTVSIEEAGLKNWVSRNVTVDVGRNTSVDAVLKPGDVTEKIEIVAESIALETTQPELGALIETKVLEELPNQINSLGRQIDNFLTLTPGVTGDSFSHRINGGLDFQNEVVFNGVVANQSETQGFQTIINPPYELVSEFRVLTSVFSAQYGLAQGVASYQFASGTNTLHGDAFEILRNSYFDAKDAATAAAGLPTSVDRENNYGFSLGGPVYLPKVYHGKDKTFFHLSVEKYKLDSGATKTETVPTQAMIGGDFSAFPSPIFVPGSFVAPAGCLNNGAAPVPGQQWFQNKIPTACFSKNSQSLLSLIPAPNASGAAFNSNYFASAATPTTQAAWGFSIDHNLTDRQKLHGTFYREKHTQITFDRLFSNVLGNPQTQPQTGTGLFLTYSNAISNNLVMTAGFGWLGELNNEFTAITNSLPSGFNAAAQASVLPTINFGGDSFAPTTFGPNNNGETFSINRKLGLSFDNNWLLTHGRHTINFGFEIRRSYQDDHECQDCGGSFNFSSNSTGDGVNFNNTGSSFASFLLGTPESAFRHLALETKLRNFYIAPYVQDNIKINPKLTVDVGLRWDIARPFTTTAVNGQPADQIVFFDPSAPNPGAISNSTGQPLLGAANVLGNCSGCAGYSTADTQWHNFSPRLGFAYRLTDKTVVLGGYALNFLDTGAYEYGVNKVAVNYGNQLASNFNVNSNGQSTTPGYCPASAGGNGPATSNCTWDSAALPVPAALTFSPSMANGTGNLHQFGRDRGKAAYVQSWNLAMQRELPHNLFVSVAYIGNRGTHLVSRLDTPNQVNPSFLNLGCVLGEAWTASTNSPGCVSAVTPQQVLQNLGFGKDASGFFSPYANFVNDVGSGQLLNQAIRPYPQFFGMVNNFDLSGVDHYNALQAQVQKRFTSGLSFLVAYTLSKTMSNADSGFSTFNGLPVDKFNKAQLWAIASDDRTHVMNISAVYELPIGPGKRLLNKGGLVAKNLLGGWQVSGVLQYASGTPLNISANGSPLRTGNIANVTGQAINVNYDNYYKGLPVFNIAAFSSPGNFAVGNAPRNIDGLRRPFKSNENLALAKHFYFGERVTAELRMEFSNILNRMRMCNPDSNGANNVDSANFGIINGGQVCQDNKPRQGQAFFKVSF